MTHEDFFRAYGRDDIADAAGASLFTPEELYQAIKARLVAELVCEVESDDDAQTNVPYTRLCPLIDRTKEVK